LLKVVLTTGSVEEVFEKMTNAKYNTPVFNYYLNIQILGSI